MLKEVIEGFRLSPQQKHLWLLQQGTEAGQFSASCVAAITGTLDTRVLKQALGIVIDRHEALHTVFRQIAGADIPLQVIEAADQVWTWREHDLSELSLREQEKQLEILTQGIRQATLEQEQRSVISAILLKQTPTLYRLVLCLPALCADAASLRDIIAQLGQEYTAILSKSGAAEDAELLQYIDFAQWQSDLLEAEEFALEREYWREKKRASQSEVQQPFEMRYAERPPFRPASIGLELTEDLLARIEQITARDEVSWSTFFLACWQLLLQRLSMQPEMVLGVAHTNRRSQEFDGALGLYAKYLPLVCASSEAQSFSALLTQLQVELQNMSNLQEYFDWEQLRDTTADAVGEPFFKFCFDGHEMISDSASGAEISITLCEHSSYIDRFHLQLTCLRSGASAHLRLDYDASFCRRTDVIVLAEQYQALVASALSDPGALVSDLRSLSASAARRILVDFNKVAATVAPDRCIQHVFEEQAVCTPHQTALIVEDKQLTYAELNRCSNQLARRLQELGVKPEVQVGLLMERSCELMVGLLGILKAGGAYVPLDPALPQERLRYLLRDSRVGLVVTQRSLRAQVPELGDLELVELDEAFGASTELEVANVRSEVQPHNLAYIIYTSGSAGNPKGVAITHASLNTYVHNIMRLLALPEGASYATASTLAADLGHTAIFPALCSGGCLHLLVTERANDPEALADYVHQYPLDCLKIVPSHLASLLIARQPERLLPARWLILGGDSTSWELARRIHALAPQCRLLNHYGPTETTVGALTYRVPAEELQQVNGAQRQLRSLPLGRPLARTQVYVLDQQMQLLSIWEAGEIYIGGSGLARGYLDREKLTAERFVPDPFSGKAGARLYRTGDLGRWQADGTLEFLGRRDQQVKVQGYRIELGEIEAALASHHAVQACVVQAREDAQGDKRLVAYIVAREAEAVEVSELRTYLQQRLPEYMLPAAFVLLPALPLMANGKLDTRALPAPDAGQQGRQEVAYVEAQTPVQAQLAAIWQQVLGLERVGIQDNFFALGGDSILSIQIVARAGQVGLMLTPKQVFQAQSIAELATLLDRQHGEDGSGVQAQQGLVHGTVPLTPVQQRFFSQNRAVVHYYNQARLLCWQGTLEAGLLAEVLAGLQEQHDALRLRFRPSEQGWQQWYAEGGASAETSLQEVDLSALAEGEQLQVLEQAAAQVQASLDLEAGPVLRAVLFRLGGQEAPRLLLVLHHLVVDGVSWRTLLEDLYQGYEQRARGEALRWPAKTSSYQQWSLALQAYAQSQELSEQVGYWQRVSQASVGRLPLLVAEEDVERVNTLASMRSVQVSLDAEQTRALLQEVPPVYHTHIQEVLLAALGLSLAHWAGAGRWRIELEGHGREEEAVTGVTLSRTVGWFTSVYPVLIEVGEERAGVETDLGSVLKGVKEQMRAIPQAGIGYGVLRYLSRAVEVGGAEAGICFNYLGQVDATMAASASRWVMADESAGPTQGREGIRSYVLDIGAIVSQGQLQLQWRYSDQLQSRDSIQELAETFLVQIRAIIAHCRQPEAGGYTPSDFPLAQLDQDNLDAIATLIEQIDQEGL